MVNGKYTAKEAAKVLRKEPRDITHRIKKGGIKEITVEETDDGFQYFLTERSIDQLGALFGISPDYSLLKATGTNRKKHVRSGATLPIDGEKLRQAIKDKGLSNPTVSRALGASDGYIVQAIGKGSIGKRQAEQMDHIFGIRPSIYVLQEEDEETEEPELTQEPKPEMDAEAIRAAIYNGFMDALVMVMKDDTLYKILLRMAEDERFVNAMQKPIFLAVNGVRNLQKKEEMNGGKLIPQNGVRR